jgi:two-component system NtrC family sensor kinase
VVVAAFQPARLDRFYARIAVHGGDRVMLVRADGAVLAQYPALAAPVGARLGAGHAMVAGMAQGAATGLVEAVGRDGVERVFAYRRIGAYPVYAAYGTDRTAIGAEIRKRLVAPGLVAVLGMLVLLASTARAQRATARMLEAERARTDSEARLRQLERVGAFGELAAGVAHDFRNAAQVMESCARLLHRSAGSPEQVRAHADMVAHAATLVATLTNRMLDIARRRPAQDEGVAFDAWQAVTGLAELLNRTVGSGCRVTARLAGVRGRMVQADRREFESALVNLVVNARDAMPEGGEVVLTVGDPPAAAAMPEGLQGSFVAVAVIDQGMGMDAQTLARAGEPFFTTKPGGQGTGLGVAGARGFAERAGGRLSLHSAPGAGTAAVLWLPVGGAGLAQGAPAGLSPSPEAA